MSKYLINKHGLGEVQNCEY